MVGSSAARRAIGHRRHNSKLLSISLAILLLSATSLLIHAADALNNINKPHSNPKKLTANIDSNSGDNRNMNDPQEILSSTGVQYNKKQNTNPQQISASNQILDRDTFGGRSPDATYPTHGDGRNSTSPSPRDALREERPPGPTSEIDDDIQKLTESLTLRELAGQMTQIQIGLLLDEKGELDDAKVRYWVGEWGVGSFLDTPSNHGGKFISYSAKQFSKIVDGIQRIALDTGKGIPILYGLDSVHGANYVDGAVLFPQQIAVAATFNTTHAYEAGRITAKDTRAAGIPWVFAPILDIAVHKLWPRVYETFGEDPYVASEMGSATIKGLQGNYKKDRTRVAACMKHFIGYSASRNGQDKSSAWIPDNILMDYFVPSFQAAVKAGVAAAMETYIDINGQPVVGSNFYLTELLRERIGFQGMLVTDWAELDRLYTEHRSVPSLKDAALQCLKQTSLDMIMVPESESFTRNADVNRTRLEESVRRVLQLKKDVGLFEQPMSDPSLLAYVGSEQDVTAARNAIRESITLLKNEKGVLPLNQDKQRKIVVTGPAANSIRALSGGWSIKWQGAETDDWYQGRGNTIFDGLKQQFKNASVSFQDSVDFDGNKGKNADSYLDVIHGADTVVLCLGEKPYAEIVGNINDLDLPQGQLDMIRNVNDRVKGTDTKVILVLVEGRPRGLRDLADKVDAIVMAYLPGPWGGYPIAEVLSGAVNPSGRLPMTYPSGPGDMVTNYYRSGVDPYQPLFTFGAGLSYSKVEYGGLRLGNKILNVGAENPQDGDEDQDDENDDDNSSDNHIKNKSLNIKVKSRTPTILAKVKVHNKSDRTVKETVFWYITQVYRSDVMPEAFLLKGFEKVELKPDETKELYFKVTKEALTYHDRDLEKKIEKGKFVLTVNAMRAEVQSAEFDVV